MCIFAVFSVADSGISEKDAWFDFPSQISYLFVVSVNNTEDMFFLNESTCAYACYAINIYKNK